MRRVAFDIEVYNSPTDRDNGFSWGSKNLLGITIACTFDLETGQWKDWLAGEAFQLVRYMKDFDQIIGFNSYGFDYPVLDGEVCRNLGMAQGKFSSAQYFAGKTVDLLMDIRDCVGQKKGTGLEKLGSCNLGMEKTAEGKFAPEMWVEDKSKLEVIEYCRGDVKITYSLFNHKMGGEVIFRPEEGSNPVPMEGLTWTVRDVDGRSITTAESDIVADAAEQVSML